MIVARSLHKSFGPAKVVHEVSFTVQPGEVLGFIGPNGAGKSTTMRLLTGFLRPDSGSASIGGHPVLEEPLAARECLGYLPETGPLYPEMKVIEFLDFICRVRRLTGHAAEQAVRRVRLNCHLEGVMEQPIETLSKGFRQRVGLAQALLHDPLCLILDEPTDGLDPNQKKEIRDLLATLSAEKAVILSTHILDDIEAMCNRVVLIHRGRLLLDEPTTALAARHPNHHAVRVIFASEADTEAARVALGNSSPVRRVERHGLSLIAFPRGPKPIFHTLLETLAAHRLSYTSIAPVPCPLDEVFRTLTVEDAG